MLNFKTVLRQALAAVALASATLVAHAGLLPTYHVTVDGTGFTAGDTGFLDVTFAGVAGGAEAIATVSNLQGNVVGVDPFSYGYIESAPGVFELSTLSGNYLSHDVTLGGVFSFDVNFSGDFLTTLDMIRYVNTFDVSLLDANFETLGMLTLSATQLSDFGPANGALASGNVLANAAAVPEPSDLLMMMTGLGLLGFTLRRRAQR